MRCAARFSAWLPSPPAARERRGVQKGYLSNVHLKQLAIYKGVYGKGSPNKMQLIKALMPDDIFKAERKKAAAVASATAGGEDEEEDGVLTN